MPEQMLPPPSGEHVDDVSDPWTSRRVGDDETLAAIGRVAAAVGRWLVAGCAWVVQYGFAVWAVMAWRVVKWLFKVVGLGVFLLLVPIVGWIMLWLIVRGRKSDRQHAELIATLNGTSTDERSIWRPWLLDWAKGGS